MRMGTRSLVEAVMALTGITLATLSSITTIGSLVVILMAPHLTKHGGELLFVYLFSGIVLFMLGLLIYVLRKRVAAAVSPSDDESYIHAQSLVAVGVGVLSISYIASGIFGMAVHLLIAIPATLPDTFIGRSSELAYKERYVLISSICSLLMGIVLFAASARIGRYWNRIQSD